MKSCQEFDGDAKIVTKIKAFLKMENFWRSNFEKVTFYRNVPFSLYSIKVDESNKVSNLKCCTVRKKTLVEKNENVYFSRECEVRVLLK